MFWITGASCLRADFGNFHQRLQRLQEDTGRDGRPGLSDAQIRKGDAEPLNLSATVWSSGCRAISCKCPHYALAGKGIDTRPLQHFRGYASIANMVRYTAILPEPLKAIWRE